MKDQKDYLGTALVFSSQYALQGEVVDFDRSVEMVEVPQRADIARHAEVAAHQQKHLGSVLFAHFSSTEDILAKVFTYYSEMTQIMNQKQSRILNGVFLICKKSASIRKEPKEKRRRFCCTRFLVTMLLYTVLQLSLRDADDTIAQRTLRECH
jgi:hypothetical protein